ncbi:hypothetical protein D3C83_193740 [compost metagenome]
MLRILSGYSGDVIARAGQHIDGEARNASGRAVHQHLAALRTQVVLLQQADGKPGGIACGAQRHRFE